MKNIAFFLLFFLLVSGYSNANAVGGSIGGWRITSNVAQGVGAKITATKDVIVNGASRAVTSSANVIPTASQVGKFMGKNLGTAAVVGAVDLLLDGVDWVIDEGGKVTKHPADDGTVYPSHQYVYQVSASVQRSTPEAACLATTMPDWAGRLYYDPSFSDYGHCRATNFYNGWLINRVNNPTYNPTATPPETVPVYDKEGKPLTLTSLGQMVIDQAQEEVRTGNPAVPIAAPVTQAAAAAVVGEAATDEVQARPIATELDKNISYSSDTDVEGEITTPEVIDPVTGEVVKPAETSSIAMQFPKACEWFPQLCLFIDWMQKPQELDEPDLPTKEIEKKEIDEELIKISSSSCPAPIDVNIPLPVFNTTYTDSISVSDYCPKIEKLAPVLQLLAFVLAIMIIKDI